MRVGHTGVVSCIRSRTARVRQAVIAAGGSHAARRHRQYKLLVGGGDNTGGSGCAAFQQGGGIADAAVALHIGIQGSAVLIGIAPDNGIADSKGTHVGVVYPARIASVCIIACYGYVAQCSR